MTVTQLKGLAEGLQKDYQVVICKACSVIRLHRSAWHYKNLRRDDQAVRRRIREIAATRVRYGYPRIHILLRREGWKDDKKRVHRIYKEEGLNLRSKRPRRTRQLHIAWIVRD